MDDTKITVCTGYGTIPEKTLKEIRCLVCLFEPEIGYINMLKSQGWGEIRREIHNGKIRRDIHDNIHCLTNMNITNLSVYSFDGPVPTCVFMFTFEDEDEYYILAGFDFRKIGITGDLNTKKLLMQKHVLHCMKFNHINPHNIFLCGITKDSEFEGTITRGMGFDPAVKSSEFYTGGFFINENDPQAYTSCNVDYPIKPLFVLAHADVCGEMKSLKPSDTSIPSVMMKIHPPNESNESSIRELNTQLTEYDSSESLDIKDTWANMEKLLESKDKDDIHSGNYARLQYHAQEDEGSKVRARVRSNILKQTQRSPKGTRLDDLPSYNKTHRTLRPRLVNTDESLRHKEFLEILKKKNDKIAAEEAEKSKVIFKRPTIRAEKTNHTTNIGDVIREQAKKEVERALVRKEKEDARKATEAESRKDAEAEARKDAEAEAITSSKSSKDKPSIIPNVVRNLFLSRKYRAKNGSKLGGSRKRNKTRKNNLPKKYANLLYRSRRASRIA
jgi:hypothetical protein